MEKVSIIIPCYQNEENIPELISALIELHQQIKAGVVLQAIFVDDGSTDETFTKLQQLREGLAFTTKVVKLSGNFGSYNALLAGLTYAEGDCFIQLHADLQDPPRHIPEMISCWQKGFKLVIGQRIKREDSITDRIFSNMYHRLIKKLAMPYAPSGGYDLILFDKQLRDEIIAMHEANTNLVYLITWLRFPYVTIPVKRMSRRKGKSQWSFRAKVKLFIDSFVAFSYAPIAFISICAFSCILIWVAITVSYFAGFIYLPFFNWILFTILTLLFVAISIVAEYLWRTLEAARGRPSFIIDQISD